MSQTDYPIAIDPISEYRGFGDMGDYEKFCCWSGQAMPSPDSVFYEQPDSVRVVRNLSTVEELEQLSVLCLGLSRGVWESNPPGAALSDPSAVLKTVRPTGTSTPP